MEEYKPNSYKSREEEQKNIQPIVTSTVKTKRRSGWDIFKEQFISEDKDKIKEYIFMDVLIPSIKNTIDDIVANSIHMLLFGGSRKASNSAPATRVSYTAYYDSNKRNTPAPRSAASTYSYSDIILETRGEADAVLNEMNAIINRYHSAKVADLYDLVGLTGNYTDNNYGWTSLNSAEIIRQRDGYLLKLPKPMPMD